MSNPSITDALHRFAAGDREAGNELIAVIGMELRRIASQRFEQGTAQPHTADHGAAQ